MQRDFGNELIVAVVAIAVIAFAVTFGILLSVSSNQDAENQTATVAAWVTDTDEPTVTHTSEPTATDTAIPSETPTPLPTATASDTPSPTATFTPVPSHTPTIETPTKTDIPDTVTPEPTATETALPNTPTTTPSETFTPTPMPSKTKTTTPSHTPSSTWTMTPVPPTRTPTATRVPPTKTAVPPTLTITPVVTLQDDSLGILPTPTGTGLGTPFSGAGNCVPPEGWLVYIVEPRTTLFTIAQAINSTVAELRVANCLENVDRIRAGNELYIPQLPIKPIATFVSSDEAGLGGGDGALSIGCANSSLFISSPSAGEVITSQTPLIGSASTTNFLYYTIEIKPYGASAYTFYARSDTPVSNGILGHLDPTAFPVGNYWVRLVVFNTNEVIPTDGMCAISVRFE